MTATTPVAPSRAEFFRHLRHELRTPINHVVGYSQLLLESAGDLPPEVRAVLVPDLARIDAAGKELLALVNTFFDGASPNELTDPHQICHDLRVPLNTIIGYAALLHEEAEEVRQLAMLPDVQRIRAAGSHLLSLLGAFLNLSPAAFDATVPRSAGTPTAPDTPPTHQPTAVTRGAAVHAPLAPTSIHSTHTGRLLVVDDDPLNRDMLSRRLLRQGHRVTLAEDGQRALDLLHAGHFDLVLLDVWMPVLSGHDVLRAMKADDTLRHLPVIVLSASDDLDSVVQCVEIGAEDYLPKPFDPVLLRARIGACLEKKRLRDQEVEYRHTIETQAAMLAEWNRTLERRVADQVEEIERINRLRRFLSPQVAKLIVSTSGEQLLESHRGHVVVCFCDLRGSTSFWETAAPDEIMQLLREYHAVLGELIFEYDGTLEHFEGDGVMVFFNDPIPCADPEVRAVKMATAMRVRMAELSKNWRALGRHIGFGVGIAAGPATMGRIGFEGRYDYAAIGPVTITASRLCGAAQDGQILITRAVLEQIEPYAGVEPLPDLTLKGFRQPVPAFNLLAVPSG